VVTQVFWVWVILKLEAWWIGSSAVITLTWAFVLRTCLLWPIIISADEWVQYKKKHNKIHVSEKIILIYTNRPIVFHFIYRKVNAKWRYLIFFFVYFKLPVGCSRYCHIWLQFRIAYHKNIPHIYNVLLSWCKPVYDNYCHWRDCKKDKTHEVYDIEAGLEMGVDMERPSFLCVGHSLRLFYWLWNIYLWHRPYFE
jgi:hypothetical protein